MCIIIEKHGRWEFSFLLYQQKWKVASWPRTRRKYSLQLQAVGNEYQDSQTHHRTSAWKWPSQPNLTYGAHAAVNNLVTRDDWLNICHWKSYRQMFKLLLLDLILTKLILWLGEPRDSIPYNKGSPIIWIFDNLFNIHSNIILPSTSRPS